MIVDFDQHLIEYPSMWQDYCDPAERHLALEVTRDELGYPWLFSRQTNQRVCIVSKVEPEDNFVSFFGPWQRWKDGLPPEVDYLADIPADCCEPGARVTRLDEMGVDKAVLFPHLGFLYPRSFPHRLDILRTNMAAWNRWAVEVRQEGQGRLEPTGYVTLRGGDPTWLEEQLAYLGRNGIRSALVGYGLADGRRMSHRDHDRAWKAFADNGIVPVFHIQDHDLRASGLEDAWFAEDGDALFGVLDIAFAHLGVQVAIADMIFGGVFDRFPELKLATVELTAGWVNPLLNSNGNGIPGSVGGGVNGPGLDISYRYEGIARRITNPLKKQPSEYFYDHVTCMVGPFEPVKQYMDGGLADNLVFGSDYPHSEGFWSPVETYRKHVPDLTDEQERKLFGANAEALLNLV